MYSGLYETCQKEEKRHLAISNSPLAGSYVRSCWLTDENDLCSVDINSHIHSFSIF